MFKKTEYSHITMSGAQWNEHVDEYDKIKAEMLRLKTLLNTCLIEKNQLVGELAKVRIKNKVEENEFYD
jgi:hypothetical protein